MDSIIEEANRASEYRKALEVVAEMRKHQQLYFAQRKKSDLIDARRLEAAVDLRLSELGIKAHL